MGDQSVACDGKVRIDYEVMDDTTLPLLLVNGISPESTRYKQSNLNGAVVACGTFGGCQALHSTS